MAQTESQNRSVICDSLLRDFMRRMVVCLFAILLTSNLAGCLEDDSDEEEGPDGDSGFWSPPLETTWQWQLSGELNRSHDVVMYDVDLFETDSDNITTLQSEGRVVICYFSAGSYEDFRSDSSEFPEEAKGDPLDEWEGEWWLDFRITAVREIMQNRLNLAVEKGCDGVEPDNMDGYSNDNGLGLSASDQLNYNRFIATEAHARNLSVGLKNDLDQIPQLVNYYDWALNEECASYNECDSYEPFITAGKAVFHVEYVDEESEGQELADSLCNSDEIEGLSTLIKTWDLTAWVITC